MAITVPSVWLVPGASTFPGGGASWTYGLDTPGFTYALNDLDVFTYGLDDTPVYTYTFGGGWSYGLDNDPAFTYTLS